MAAINKGPCRPYRSVNQLNRKFPINPPAHIKAAIIDCSSDVSGPDNNGVSMDDNIGKFGEGQPHVIPHVKPSRLTNCKFLIIFGSFFFSFNN